MPEDYIRPPVVGLEARSQTASIWRFRIAMILVAALIVLMIVLVTRFIVSSGEGSPDVSTVGTPGPAVTARP